MTELSLADPRAVDDHALMLAVRGGEVGRLGDLFTRHHTRLFGFFFRLTGHRASSEDLVQLVFYRILRYRHTYRDAGNFRTWMYHIARRTLHDYRRHAGWEHAGVADTDIDQLEDDAPSADQSARDRDEAALLARAMALLGDDEREILVLARFEEMPHAEIADVLNISAGAVKVRVHRAMKELRRIFLRLSDQPGATIWRPQSTGEAAP